MASTFQLSGAVIVPLDAEGSKPFVGNLVVEKGRIAWLGPAEDMPGRYLGISQEELSGQALLPGLINGHIHSEAVIFRGLLEGLTLIEQYHPTCRLNELLTPKDTPLIRKLAYLECAKGGTTFILDHAFTTIKGDICEPFRTVGVWGGLTLGEKTAPEDFQMVAEGGFLPYINAPGEEDWTEETLTGYARLRDKLEVPLYLHLAETTWRWQIARDRFNASPVAALDKFGTLESGTVGVHGVWMDEDDIALLAKNATAIVNTPTSEMKLGDGVAPLPRLLSAGVKVGLGTDGALWNNGNDMLAEAKVACLLHRLTTAPNSLSAENALRLATIDGARCFGVEKETGSLEVGKRADMFTINLIQPHLQPIYMGEVSNIIDNFVFCASQGDVCDVWVAGEKIISGGFSTRIEEEKLIGDFALLAENLQDKIKNVIPRKVIQE